MKLILWYDSETIATIYYIREAYKLKKIDNLKCKYSVQEALKLTDKEFDECAQLFSNSYGKYNDASPIRPGQQVRMGKDFFVRRFRKDNVYIATARYRSKLIGQAVYIRKKYEDVGTMTWIMQLVVDADYRENGIGSTLLHSIWGFSNDFAWGLATANPCTVKALESATFRKCNPVDIKQNLKYIKRLADDISFVKEDGFEITEEQSIVNTEFFIDNSEYSNPEVAFDNWMLGELKPGYEWLAFTFRNQDINPDKYYKHFNDLVAFSENKLQQAYSRMKMNAHSWTKGTVNEIDAILNRIDLKDGANILDLGCGIGRHSIELAKRGYDVLGIDFSARHIAIAKRNAKELKVDFKTCDIRGFSGSKEYDLALCLFDVIGSFPEKEDNIQILKTAINHMKEGAYCVISVMNMELTEHLVSKERKINIFDQPEELFKLQPSNTMQQTGDIFNPEYILIDKQTSLVYRKEQFNDDEELPAEYLVRDKRYTMREITSLVESVGLKVLQAHYVQAGHFDIHLSSKDKKAKEILVIAQK